MSGGAGGGRGGGGTKQATGSAKETRFCWRESDNLWRTTAGLAAAVGGQPLRGGSAACASSGVWQDLRR
jgi:hypothetical protein